MGWRGVLPDAPDFGVLAYEVGVEQGELELAGQRIEINQRARSGPGPGSSR